MSTPGPANGHHEKRAAIPLWLGACLFLAMALFLLWEEHRAHIWVHFRIFCSWRAPWSNLFMHRGHGQNGSHHGSPPDPPSHDCSPLLQARSFLPHSLVPLTPAARRMRVTDLPGAVLFHEHQGLESTGVDLALSHLRL